jgi:hypothetical protein
VRSKLRPALGVATCLVAFAGGGAVRASPGDGMRVPDDVRLISYFPAHGGWTLMWTRFDTDAIDRDLSRISSLGANTVRVIVPTAVFGYPVPAATMSARLATVVDLAARHGLFVELTLFDWWHDYADVAGSRRWVAALLARYADDPRVASVELKNEIKPQDDGAAEWAAALIPYVRAIVHKPVGISVPALDPAGDLRLLRAALASAQPDFYSVHFYWRPELAAAYLAAAKAAVAPLPLQVGETGYSTAIPYEILPGVPASTSAREAQQAYYLRSLALATDRLGLPAIAPWILSDFAPEAIPADDPGVYGNPREYLFGLYRVGGEAKPAAAELRSIFSGRDASRLTGFNGGFEDAVRDDVGNALPAFWRIRTASNATFSRDPLIAHHGLASARISGAATGTRPDAAFVIAPPDAAVRPGDRSTITGFARASSMCGEVRLALRWFSVDGRAVGGVQSAPLRCGVRGWRRLRASGVAPTTAAYVGVFLRAAGTVGSAWFDDVSYVRS